jgi:hypothetical protein
VWSSALSFLFVKPRQLCFLILFYLFAIILLLFVLLGFVLLHGFLFFAAARSYFSSPTVTFFRLGVAPPTSADGSNRDSGEAFHHRLESMLLVPSSQPHESS